MKEEKKKKKEYILALTECKWYKWWKIKNLEAKIIKQQQKPTLLEHN